NSPQQEPEPRALGIGVVTHTSAGLLHDLLHHGQADPSASGRSIAGRVDSEEALEYPLAGVEGDPLHGVGYAHADRLAPALRPDEDHGSRRRIAARVVKQIEEDLGDLVRDSLHGEA